MNYETLYERNIRCVKKTIIFNTAHSGSPYIFDTQ